MWATCTIQERVKQPARDKLRQTLARLPLASYIKNIVLLKVWISSLRPQSHATLQLMDDHVHWLTIAYCLPHLDKQLQIIILWSYFYATCWEINECPTEKSNHTVISGDARLSKCTTMHTAMDLDFSSTRYIHVHVTIRLADVGCQHYSWNTWSSVYCIVQWG